MSNVLTGIAQQRKTGSGPRKAVLMYFCDRASDDGSGVWTSKSHIADDLELSRRTVQYAIRDLIEMGVVFEVGQRSHRNGFTCEYRVDLLALKGLGCTRSGSAPETGARDAHVQEVHPTRARDARQDVQEVHTNHPITTLEPPTIGQGSDFDAFWDAYPRKVKKTGARKKFLALSKKVPASEIIRGAERYALAMRDTDAKFISHPTTWLSNGCWEDEDAQSPLSGARTEQQGRWAKMRAEVAA